MGIADHLTCLLSNLHAGREATVRTGHRTTDWFKIGQGVRQDCILSPSSCNVYVEYIMWNAELDEAQARIKIAGGNIKNLRFADWMVVAEPWKILGFLASRGEEFNPGPVIWLDRSELLCNKILLKYKRDRERYQHRQQKGEERMPPPHPHPSLVLSKKLYTY